MACNHMRHHHQQHSDCGCGCHTHGLRRHSTAEEQRARLEQYKDDLSKELQAVEARIKELEGKE